MSRAAGRENRPEKRPAARRWKRFRCRALSAQAGLAVAAGGARRMPVGARRLFARGGLAVAARGMRVMPAGAPRPRLGARAVCLSAPADSSRAGVLQSRLGDRASRRRGYALFDNRIGSGCTNEPLHGPPVVPSGGPTRLARPGGEARASRAHSAPASDFASLRVRQIPGGASGAPELFPGHPPAPDNAADKRAPRPVPPRYPAVERPKLAGDAPVSRGACPRVSLAVETPKPTQPPPAPSRPWLATNTRRTPHPQRTSERQGGRLHLCKRGVRPKRDTLAGENRRAPEEGVSVPRRDPRPGKRGCGSQRNDEPRGVFIPARRAGAARCRRGRTRAVLPTA